MPVKISRKIHKYKHNYPIPDDLRSLATTRSQQNCLDSIRFHLIDIEVSKIEPTELEKNGIFSENQTLN